MKKYDDFDLDLKQTKSTGNHGRITSVSACTPGSCWQTCAGAATLHSNCCIGSAICSLGTGCRP